MILQTYSTFWSYMVLFCKPTQHFGRIWYYFANLLNILVVYGLILQTYSTFGHIWSYLTNLLNIWSYMVLSYKPTYHFGHIWFYLTNLLIILVVYGLFLQTYSTFWSYMVLSYKPTQHFGRIFSLLSGNAVHKRFAVIKKWEKSSLCHVTCRFHLLSL